jgi:hypothetical protein
MADRLYGNLTDAAADDILDGLLANCYVALYTDTPGDAGGGTEVSGGSYARQAATFAAASDGVASNSVAIEFPEATAAWGTVKGWGILDADIAGNLIYFAPLVARATLGDSTTQFDITQTGLVVRYTYDGTGTDPSLAADNPTPGDVVVISTENFSAANNGRFVVIGSGENYFEVMNQDGVAEENKTIGGALRSILHLAPTTKAVDASDSMKFDIGRLTVRLD